MFTTDNYILNQDAMLVVGGKALCSFRGHIIRGILKTKFVTSVWLFLFRTELEDAMPRAHIFPANFDIQHDF